MGKESKFMNVFDARISRRMKSKLLMLLIPLTFPVQARILLVPQSYPTLQNAIYSARCKDTIVADSVPDKASITFNSKVLWFIGSPKGDSSKVTIYVPININYSKCYLKNFKVIGSKGGNRAQGIAAISTFRSQLEVDSCTFNGGEGGPNTNDCGRVQGGAGLLSSFSTLNISNSMCIGGYSGTVPGSCVFPPPPTRYFGISLKDSSVLEKNAIGGDSIAIDSTSYISLSGLTLNYDCYTFGSDTTAFSIFPYQKFIGTPYGTVNCYDYNNDNMMDFFMSGVSGTSIYAGNYINKGDWNFSNSEGGPFTSQGGNVVSLGDVDNDGDVDFLKGEELSKNGTIRDSGGSWYSHYNASFCTFGDYNNDGRLDILEMPINNDTDLCLLWKNAKPRFILDSQMLLPIYPVYSAWGDFDKDFDNDLIISGSHILAIGSGTRLYQNEQAHFSLRDSLDGSRKCGWFDLNSDGKLEALIDASMYVLNGSLFERPPITIPGWFVIGDMDNDGELDIITPGTVYLYEGGTWVSLGYETGISPMYGCAVADLDNDGDLDIVVMGNWGTQPNQGTRIIRNNCKVKNMPPNPPSALRTTINGNEVLFGWSAALDDHTPQQSLSYSLRVGTTPLGCEIMSPVSDPITGYHFIPQMGNVSLDTGWILKALPAGTYYWSVQAIDNCWFGSSFAPEQSFSIGQTKIARQITAKDVRVLVRKRNIYFYASTFPGEHLIISIFDIKGRILSSIQKKSFEKITISLGEDLPPGIYFYRIIALNEVKKSTTLLYGKINTL